MKNKMFKGLNAHILFFCFIAYAHQFEKKYSSYKTCDNISWRRNVLCSYSLPMSYPGNIPCFYLIPTPVQSVIEGLFKKTLQCLLVLVFVWVVKGDSIVDPCLIPVAGAKWYHRLSHCAEVHLWTHPRASVQTLEGKMISTNNLEMIDLVNQKVKESWNFPWSSLHATPLYLLFLETGTEPGALCLPSQCSATELNPQPL